MNHWDTLTFTMPDRETRYYCLFPVKDSLILLLHNAWSRHCTCLNVDESDCSLKYHSNVFSVLARGILLGVVVTDKCSFILPAAKHAETYRSR